VGNYWLWRRGCEGSWLLISEQCWRAIFATRDFLDQEIEWMDKEVDSQMYSFEEAIQRVDEIPGIGCRNAQEILAETGLDMERFPSAAHFASWAKLCPVTMRVVANDGAVILARESPRFVRLWWKQAGHPAIPRTLTSRPSITGWRLAREASARFIAVAHTILVTIYHMMKHRTIYRDLGGTTSMNETEPETSEGRSSVSSVWATG
jgi:hypothetical protein